MTATERLRELLDERGAGYREHRWGGKHSITTIWHAMGAEWHYRENGHGELRLHVDGLTPEQAIEATLGRGECHNAAPSYLDFLCSECGFVHYHSDENDDGNGNKWNYCPNCGRKVVKE